MVERKGEFLGVLGPDIEKYLEDSGGLFKTVIALPQITLVSKNAPKSERRRLRKTALDRIANFIEENKEPDDETTEYSVFPVMNSVRLSTSSTELIRNLAASGTVSRIHLAKS